MSNIKGYRELTNAEVEKVNAIKTTGETLRVMIASLRSSPEYDQRWVSIAETHLQQGIMAAVRSITQPTTF